MARSDRSASTDERHGRSRTPAPDGAVVRGRTTIELYTTDAGRWLATQRGVDVVGRGDTAPQAAGEYCRKLDDEESD